MAEKKRVPQVRFAGFEDEWKQRKFSSITYSAGEKNKDNLPFESYSITNENGFIPQVEKFENGGTMWDADKRMYFIVSPNSFAYNPARINVGSIGYQNLDKNVIVSSLYEIFKTTDEVNDRFLWHWFKSNDFQKLILQLQEGGVRLYFYYDKLCMGAIPLPSVDEQHKIGRFLDKLNNLITLHLREHNKLLNFKKSMLDKMFPKNGANVPEIRFTEFTTAWELCRFDSLYKKVTEKNDLSYHSDKIISVANMYFKPDAIISEEEYLKTYNVFKLGDIAFEGNKSKSFSHGRFVENTIGDGIISHVFDVFRPIMNDYDLLFWQYAINNENLMKHTLIRCTKASTMMTNLVSSDFLKEYFYVPQVKEQKKIGRYLSLIDTRITICQSELEKLQNLKKALLEKMFV